MIKSMNLNLTVDIEKKIITTTVNIELSETLKVLEFGINQLLHVDYIICYAQNVNYDVEDNYKLEFRAECQKIIVKIPESEKNIEIKYSGSINGWHNCITDKLVALNYYSVWYPMFTSDNNIEKVVTIHGLDDFTIIKGKKIDNSWLYENNDFDCNIIAIKDWGIKSRNIMSTNVNVYSSRNDIESSKQASMLLDSFSSILQYYVDLLEIKSLDIDSFDIVINSDNKSGGYCRNKLIVLCELSNEVVSKERFLAHECAHIWATGANTETWEDWLNETFAECMALLYIRKMYGNEQYLKYINRRKDRADNSPPIKTEDGSRPNGVHDKGTYLMHMLAEKYGVDILIKIIRLFIKLENKTTNNLLLSIKKEIDLQVANYIENNLVK